MGVIIKKFAFLILLAFGIILPSNAQEFDLEKAVKEIRAAPDWTTETDDSLPLVQSKITDVYLLYLDISSKDARSLVVEMMASGERFDASNYGRIHLFNKMFCNVPEVVERADWKFFGGWMGFPVSDETVGALYPLAINVKGKLKLVGVYRGFDAGI